MITRKGDTLINAQGQELVGHGTATFPLGCYEEDIWTVPIHWHWHEDWELIQATRGVVHTDTSAGRFSLGPGEAVFLGPGCVHEITGEAPGAQLRSAVFHPRLLADQDSLIWQKYLQPLQGVGAVLLDPGVAWQQECIRLFCDCWSALDQEPFGFELRAREALARMALLLAARVPPDQRSPSPAQRRSSQRLKVMLRFIQEHCGDSIGLPEIAASAGLSKSSCLRCFRETINTTPWQYLRDYRIQKAAGLLASTDAPIGEVGAACGFFDAAYFTKTFREAQGCTPGSYRRSQRQPSPDCRGEQSPLYKAPGDEV